MKLFLYCRLYAWHNRAPAIFATAKASLVGSSGPSSRADSRTGCSASRGEKQEDPRNVRRSTPVSAEPWLTLAAIARLSYRNSAGRVRFASIPPTAAAARNTASGRADASQSSTACWRRRSSVLPPDFTRTAPVEARRRVRALPTMPRSPATQTRLPTRSYAFIVHASYIAIDGVPQHAEPLD